jgi:hypothetical protein
MHTGGLAGASAPVGWDAGSASAASVSNAAETVARIKFRRSLAMPGLTLK